MPELRLGPLLRYVDESSATVWVETDRPCEVHVRCASGAGGAERTWQVAGHHYALVPVAGLTPDTETPYRVLLDGQEVWPLPDSRYPPSTIRTLRAGSPETLRSRNPETLRAGEVEALRGRGAETLRAGGAKGADSPEAVGGGSFSIAFGSCRWSAPPTDSTHDPVGPDALDTLAYAIGSAPGRERPDVLLLLGDQIYADQTSATITHWIAARRDVTEPPWTQVADYEEYTRLYYESWLDPEVRWLLSTVPSLMIFDDHDVIDDWNTSTAWLTRMRATPWWRERVLGGLMSYWVHQHLGNLSPAALAADELYARVRAAKDGTELVREFAAAADADPAAARWSYRRDFGRVRLIIVDTRATRVLEEDRRAMLDPAEAKWVRREALADPGSYDHLLIGSSLPWLLPNLIHDAEAWNAALCGGERGARWARRGEYLRRRADLEHWAAFPDSFVALTELIAEAGSGARAPATICVLSGDVHHAYVAEAHWKEGREPDARVLQLTCSPIHNSIPASMRVGFRLGWSRTGRALGRLLSRHGRTALAPIRWRRTGGPWFGNQLMTLSLCGRSARLRLEQARRDGLGAPTLETVLDRPVSGGAGTTASTAARTTGPSGVPVPAPAPRIPNAPHGDTTHQDPSRKRG